MTTPGCVRHFGETGDNLEGVKHARILIFPPGYIERRAVVGGKPEQRCKKISLTRSES
jgi:hypothetical protein